MGFMQNLGTRMPQDIVDLGCATGLSTLELGRCYPEAKILGLDLSPYFLAVAKALQQQRSKVPLTSCTAIHPWHA